MTFFYAKLHSIYNNVLYKEYFTNNIWKILYTIQIIQDANTFTNSISILHKFCLVPFHYNLISVLCPYGNFFQILNKCLRAFKNNLILLLDHSPLKIIAAITVNVASMLFCRRWNNVNAYTFWPNFYLQTNLNVEIT